MSIKDRLLRLLGFKPARNYYRPMSYDEYLAHLRSKSQSPEFQKALREAPMGKPLSERVKDSDGER